MLLRKLLRDLRRDAGLLLAVVAVVALGVTLFVTSADGYLDLSTSYARLQDDLGLADLHVDAPVDDATAARVAALPGVAAVDRRTLRSVPLTLGGHTLEGRVITLPDSGQPALDRLHVDEGALPGPGEVVVESHLAEAHDLHPGDTIELGAGDATTKAKVAAVATSAEYLWVSRDAQDPMPTPDEFGVVWMRASDAIGVDAREQLLVDVAPGADVGRVEEDVASVVGGVVGAAGSPVITRREDLVGVRLLQMDVDGLRGMALFFPVFFLGVAMFVFAAVLARVVDAQRPLVGTMLALGVPRGRVLRHYLAFAAIVGGFGAALGTAVGIAGGWGLTTEYAGELHIPEVVTEPHPALWLGGFGLGLAASFLAGWAPARRAAAFAPAEAMRTAAPSGGRAMTVLRRLGRLPLWLRLAIRGVVRRPVRSAATALGVAAALVLVLVTGGLVESMERAMTLQLDDAWRYDLRVDLALPSPTGDVRARIAAVPGVKDVETALAVPVKLEGKGKTEDVLALGLVPEPKLLRSVDLDGRSSVPSPGGVSLPRALMKKLHVTVGDEVIATAPGGEPVRMKVDGVSESAMGATAVFRQDDLGRLSSLAGAADVAVLTVDPARRDDVRDALYDVPGAVRVQDAASLREIIDQVMALSWAMVGAMLACSVVLAGAVLYDTTTLSILERRRELATLRALGGSMREIAATVTAEHAALGVAGLLLGLPVAVVALHGVIHLYDSDLFSLPYVMSGRSVAVAVVGVALVLLVAQAPALRQIARSDLASAVRSREG